MRAFFRLFFGFILFGSIFFWAWYSYVRAAYYEAILVSDKYQSASQDDIIFPSDWRFVFYRIYPERVTLYPITLFPRTLNFQFRKGLEQSEMLGLDDSFYIRVLLHLNYELEPEKLRTLFSHLPSRNWEELNSYIKLRLQTFLEKRLSAFYKNEKELLSLKSLMQNYFLEEGLKEINAQFKKEGIFFHSIHTKHIFVPDLARYRSILGASQQIIRQKLERIRLIDQARAKKKADIILSDSYFSRLERIGELLKTYPHLRDYLVIDKLNKNVNVLVMPYQRWFPERLQNLNNLNALSQSNNKSSLPKAETTAENSLNSFTSSFTKESNDVRPSNDSGTINSESSQFSDLTPP